MSIVGSLGLIGIASIGMMIIWWILRKYKGGQIESNDFKQTYGTSVYEGTRNTLFGHYWSLFVLGRWSLTCSIMIFLRNYAPLQILTLLSTSVLTQIILIYSPPFTSITDNRMTFFNELATSVYLYLLVALTDYHQAIGLRDRFSTALAYLISFAIGINSLRIFPRIFGYLKSGYL